MINFEQVKDKLEQTSLVVEATSFEAFALWQNYKSEVKEWKQEPGTLIQIGEFSGNPICVQIMWEIIDSKRVLFWEATSRIADFDMINEFFKCNCPKAVIIDNAFNFWFRFSELKNG